MKQLYKTFLISVLSGSLLMFQMTAVATEVTGSASVSSASSTASSSSATPAAEASTSVKITTDPKTGLATQTSTHKFEKIEDSDMLASIAMLAAGFITALIVKAYRPITTDAMVATAAGAAFIAGEIMSNMSFKGKIDEMTIEVTKKSDGTVNEEQMQRLLDLKKSYEEAKKTTKTKKMLQLAAAAAYALAGVMALFAKKKETVAMASCVSTVKANSALCTMTAPAYLSLLSSYNVARDKPGLNSNSKNAEVRPIQATLTEPFTCPPVDPAKASLVAATTAAAIAVNTACKPALIELGINQSSTPVVPAITASQNKFLHKLLFVNHLPTIKSDKPGFLYNLMNFILPEAKAGWMPLLGLGAGAMAALVLIGGTTGLHLDRFMYTPMNRTIVFGTLAGIAYMAVKSSDNTLKKLDDNLAKIQIIIDEMNQLAKGIKGTNVKEQGIKIKTTATPDAQLFTFSEDGKSLTPCMNNDSNSSCMSIDQLKLMSNWSNLPESLRNAGMQAVTLGSSLSGASGISGAALDAATALGNNQAALSRLLTSRQNDYNKIPGVKKVDFDKEQKNFLRALTSKIGNDLKKNGMTPSVMMASLGSTQIKTGGEGDDKEATLKKNPFGQNGGTLGAAATTPAAEKEDEKEFNLDLKEAAAPEFIADASGMGSRKAEYDIPTNEINADNGPTIFEVISNRYLKSGYPKLLEENITKK